MVQLKKSTIPRGRRTVRRHTSNRNNQPVTPREWAMLLTAVGGCTYLLSSFFPIFGIFSFGGGSFAGGGDGGAAAGPGGVRKIAGHTVAHGRGRRVPELSDAYNAIANDVVRVLDCSKVVPEQFSFGDGDGGGGAFSGDRDGGMWDDVARRDDYVAGGRDGAFGGGGGGGPGAAGQQQQKPPPERKFLDDDGRIPDALNNRWDGGIRRQRRRLQIVDDDGGMNPENNGAANGAGPYGGMDNFNDQFDADFQDDAFGRGGGWGDGGGGGDFTGDNYDEGFGGAEGVEWNVRPRVNGRHLMCLAAGADNLPEEAKMADAFKCDVLGSKRELLLDLWESARGQQIPIDIIQKSLDHAFEHTQTLLDNEVHLWSPWDDDGLTYVVNNLNTKKDWNHGGIKGLDSALGPHKLFIDIGSTLGLTAMGISLTYPGTAVVAIEPAAPSWLMQELNLRCNSLHPQPHIRSVLAGVGPKNDGMAKMMWRPTSTTSTRTWTPKSEHRSDDIELTVHLRNIRTILAEGMPDDLPYNTPISVMNLDCEGCEYDVVPSFTDADFDAIDIIIGEIHWGYIPSEKLPSSERARKTHERLCKHEAFARDKIECCAFPNMQVDTILDTASTVKELAGSLCDGFEKWAKEHYLNDIPDDVGWFELSAEWDY